jgi:hypothetical protein
MKSITAISTLLAFVIAPWCHSTPAITTKSCTLTLPVGTAGVSGSITLPAQSQVEVTEKLAGWCYISKDPYYGWIESSYITIEVSTPPTTKNNSAGNDNNTNSTTSYTGGNNERTPPVIHQYHMTVGQIIPVPTSYAPPQIVGMVVVPAQPTSFTNYFSGVDYNQVGDVRSLKVTRVITPLCGRSIIEVKTSEVR